ncbi:hypothetical protein ABFS82_08G109000 [Erythranthe guttata]|nr:PREDICTED: uncharacterized protein LOC105970538 [Erythranthe guttata]|eukprot:XP_012850826.1 PREDICTED: uncharacterized protein LOC105970538 [Erythranthe guttata]
MVRVVTAGISIVAAPRMAPPAAVSGGGVDRDDEWRSFDNSVSAVSFGFVATAVLICMFLVMAIFEKFLRPRSPAAAGRNPASDDEANVTKLDYPPSPKVTVYPQGVSVLMPGERIPTFLAHPAPVNKIGESGFL